MVQLVDPEVQKYPARQVLRGLALPREFDIVMPSHRAMIHIDDHMAGASCDTFVIRRAARIFAPLGDFATFRDRCFAGLW